MEPEMISKFLERESEILAVGEKLGDNSSNNTDNKSNGRNYNNR